MAAVKITNPPDGWLNRPIWQIRKSTPFFDPSPSHWKITEWPSWDMKVLLRLADFMWRCGNHVPLPLQCSTLLYIYIYYIYIYNIIPVVIEWRSVAFARPWSVTRLDPLFPVLWAGLLNLKLGQGVNLMERKHWNVLQSHFMLLLFLQKTSPVGRVKHYWYNSLYFPKGPSRTLEPHENDENGSIKVPWDRGVPAPLAPSTPQVESSVWPWHSRPVPRRCHGRNVMVRFAGSRPTNLEMIS